MVPNTKANSGGKRPNSGPKRSTSPYGEATVMKRIPLSLKDPIDQILNNHKLILQKIGTEWPIVEFKSPMVLPMSEFKVAAGQSFFSSPAQQYATPFNLGEFLITNPPSTYLYTVGKDYDSMISAGIMPNSRLIIDRSLPHRSGMIVLASVNGEELIKRLYKYNGVIELRSENEQKNYPPITFKEGDELIIIGVHKWTITGS